MNLTKVQNLCSENNKTLMKEIKEDLNKWKDIPCSWIGRLNIVKIVIYPQIDLQVQPNPYKYPSWLLCRN